MVAKHNITVEGIEFIINKKMENNFIVKQISFTDKGKQFNFEERVNALKLKDFENYFSTNNFKIEDLRGDYNMNKFDSKTSDRLIVIAKKIKE